MKTRFMSMFIPIAGMVFVVVFAGSLSGVDEYLGVHERRSLGDALLLSTIAAVVLGGVAGAAGAAGVLRFSDDDESDDGESDEGDDRGGEN